MQQSKATVRDQLRQFSTFEDVIALALAKSKKKRFSADTLSWSNALYKICDRFSEEVPELRDVFFNQRPPLAPHSMQVYDIITLLARSQELSLPNPQLQYIIIDTNCKKRILQNVRHLTYGPEIIGEITCILDREVSLPQ